MKKKKCVVLKRNQQPCPSSSKSPKGFKKKVFKWHFELANFQTLKSVLSMKCYTKDY